MNSAEHMDVPSSHLELIGFELNTGRDVYRLTREADAVLLISLEVYGYVKKTRIKLINDEIVDGWVNIYDQE